LLLVSGPRAEASGDLDSLTLLRHWSVWIMKARFSEMSPTLSVGFELASIASHNFLSEGKLLQFR
jgi:hypothetical protein